MNATEQSFTIQMPGTGSILYCRAHQYDGDELVLSVDLLRHMEELPVQQLHAEPDEFDLFLLKPRPWRRKNVHLEYAHGRPVAKRPRKNHGRPVGIRELKPRKYTPRKACTLGLPIQTASVLEKAGVCSEGEKPGVREEVPEAPASPTPDEPAKPVPPQPQVPQECRLTKKTPRMRHQSDTDQRIFDLVRELGCRWREIARIMGGREAGFNDDVIRNRYIRCMQALGTPYQTSHARRGPSRKPSGPVERWSEEEDQIIWSGMLQMGPRWDRIAIRLPNRTSQAVRNRANRIGMVKRLNEWFDAAREVSRE